MVKTPLKKKNYNYRHSRARRVIENAFGILTARQRIFRKPIRGTVANVKRCTLAYPALHNYLHLTDNTHYLPVGFIDSEDKDGNICRGEWRQMRCNQSGNLQRLQPVKGSRIRQNILQIKNNLKNYLNSEGGNVPCHEDLTQQSMTLIWCLYY